MYKELSRNMICTCKVFESDSIITDKHNELNAAADMAKQELIEALEKVLRNEPPQGDEKNEPPQGDEKN